MQSLGLAGGGRKRRGGQCPPYTRGRGGENAYADAGTVGLVQVGRRQLRLTNLGKVLYPEVGFTKGEVVDYYRRGAPVLLPHLGGRPLTLKRYPDGVGEGYFYEKRCPAHRPGWDWRGRWRGHPAVPMIDTLGGHRVPTVRQR